MTSAIEVGEGGGAPASVIVRELVKRYPKAQTNAVDSLSFSVAKGEIFGLLGPNGAGKSTTVGILTTRVQATGGQATVAGVDVMTRPKVVRSLLGVVPQRNNLDRWLTVRQNLLFHAAYHGVKASVRRQRVETLLDEFGLTARANEKPDLFSGGEAQRMMIARALTHAPAVLFLDEPTTGLDPAARLFVWERIKELKSTGVTIMLTTHDMDEAAILSDRVGIIDHGRLLALDTPQALVRALPGKTTLSIGASLNDGTPPQKVVDQLALLDGVERIEPDSSHEQEGASEMKARLYVKGDPALMLAPVATAVEQAGGRLTGVDIGAASLEDVFIQLTGRRLR